MTLKISQSIQDGDKDLGWISSRDSNLPTSLSGNMFFT